MFMCNLILRVHIKKEHNNKVNHNKSETITKTKNMEKCLPYLSQKEALIFSLDNIF